MTQHEEQEYFNALGLEVIRFLGLRTKRNGRVDTGWGDKSPEGLGRSIARITQEHEQEHKHA